MRKNILLSILTLLFVGCTTIPELSPKASNVKVFSMSEAVSHCKSMGLVHGYSDNGFEGYGGRNGISQRHSVFDAQNKAHSIGADSILIVNTNTRTGGTDTVAEAFNCKADS